MKAFRSAILSALLLSGCVTVQLISAYDEFTEKLATEMQGEFDAFRLKIDTAVLGSGQLSFASNRDFYKQQYLALKRLDSRVNALPKNQIAVEKVKLLGSNYSLLLLRHKGCLTGDRISDAQREAIESMGPDVSDSCRIAYGASIEVPDASANNIKPAEAKIALDLISGDLRSIVALELSKKSGDK